MPGSGPGPSRRAMRSLSPGHSSEDDQSRGAQPESPGPSSRKRKADVLSSPSHRRSQKAPKLTPRASTAGRNNVPAPSASSLASPHTLSLNAHRPLISTSGSPSIATQRKPNTHSRNLAYKEPSKLFQRPALSQPSFSAKTKVKRNNRAREIQPSSDSSELPEGILPSTINGIPNWKNVKPLSLAAERKKRGSLPIGSPETRKSAGSKSLKGTAPKQFIGEVIEISSSDEDRRKTTRSPSRVKHSFNDNQTSPIEISSDESTRVPNKIARSPAKVTKNTSHPSHSQSMPSKSVRPGPSLTIETGTSPPTPPTSTATTSISQAPLVTAAMTQLVDSARPLSPPGLLDNLLDLNPDPDPFNGFDGASSFQDVSNRDVQDFEVSTQKPISPEQVLPIPANAVENATSVQVLASQVLATTDLSHPEVPPIPANAAENATAGQVLASQVSATTNLNELRINAMLTPIETDVALLNLASDGKDVRALDPSRKLLSPLSSIYSSQSGSEPRIVQTSSAPPRLATSHRINDSYPTTSAVWGHALRRVERQTLKTGSTSDVDTRPTGPTFKNDHRKDMGDIDLDMDFNTITSNTSAQQESRVSRSLSPLKSPLRQLLTSGENNLAEGNGDGNLTSPKSARSVATPRMTQSPSSSKSPRRASSRVSSTSSRGKAHRKSQTPLSPSTANSSSSSSSGGGQSVSDAINRARREYFVHMQSKSPEASVHPARQSSQGDNGHHDRHQRLREAISSAAKLDELCQLSTKLPDALQITSSSPMPIQTPCSEITRELSVLSLVHGLEEVKYDTGVSRAMEHTTKHCHTGIDVIGTLYGVETDTAQHSVGTNDMTAKDVTTTNSSVLSPPRAMEQLSTSNSAVQHEDVDMIVADRVERLPPPTVLLSNMQVVDMPNDRLDRGPFPQGQAFNAQELSDNVAHLHEDSFQGMGVDASIDGDNFEPIPDEKSLSDDSDGMILVYPDEEELLSATEDAQVSTEELPAWEDLDQTSSGVSTMSSIHPSRSASLSRASSSDPINLLGFEQKSQPMSTSLYPVRYLQQTKQLAVFTWPDFRDATRRSQTKHLLAKNLPHTLLDNMNAMHAYFRSLPMNRTIFEETISDNTMDDEPDAPPIRIINEIDDEPTPPWEFYYTNQMWHGDGVPPPDMKSLPSCDCVGSCDPKSTTCACLKRQQEFTREFTPDFAYDRRGRLKQNDIPIFECNELCGCDDDCRNRIVQRGRKCVVNIGKTREKGWGVFAGPKKIPSGTYIGIYSGELLTDAESEMRGLTYNSCGRTYLFDIDHHHLRKAAGEEWEVKYVVDAYHAGNFTRFLNHSCDPNCTLNACYINDANIDKPLLAVFTQRDVEPLEELCFSYSGAPDADDVADKVPLQSNPTNPQRKDAIYTPCRCGASNCTGIMFK